MDSNIRSFIGGKEQDQNTKDECIKTAQSLVDDLKSGKITGFAAVGVAENLDIEYLADAYGTNNSTLVMTGAVTKLLLWLNTDEP